MKARFRLVPLALLAAATLIPAAADAHHSAAMYDATKTVTLNGAIKDFHWMNPTRSSRCWLQRGGRATDLNFECSTPNILVRGGWSIHSLKAGDMVSIQVHPMKDGGTAGIVLSVKTPSGEVLKDHGAVAGAAPAYNPY